MSVLSLILRLCTQIAFSVKKPSAMVILIILKFKFSYSSCRDFTLVQLTEEKVVLKDAIKNHIYLCIYLRSYVSVTGPDAGWPRKQKLTKSLPSGSWLSSRGAERQAIEMKHHKRGKSTEWISDRARPSEEWHLDRDMNQVKELWECFPPGKKEKEEKRMVLSLDVGQCSQSRASKVMGIGSDGRQLGH